MPDDSDQLSAENVLAFLRNAQEAAERGSEEHREFLHEAHALSAPLLTEPLRPLESAFVRAYFMRPDASLAARLAGSKSTDPKVLKSVGYKILHRPRVQAALAELHRKAELDAVVTRDEVVVAMKTAASGASRTKQYAAAIAAWAHLGKEIGMFTDKLDVKVDARVQDILELARPHCRDSKSYEDVVQAIGKALGFVDSATADAEADLH